MNKILKYTLFLGYIIVCILLYWGLVEIETIIDPFKNMRYIDFEGFYRLWYLLYILLIFTIFYLFGFIIFKIGWKLMKRN